MKDSASTPAVPPLPTLPGMADPDLAPETEATAGDLAEMISLLRQQIQSHQHCDGSNCAELRTQEKTLSYLLSKLETRVTAEDDSPNTPLGAAERYADVLRFEVGESHRRNAAGQAITAAKKVFVHGLKPFHTEALRPQAAFNVEVTSILEHLSTYRGTGPVKDVSGWVRRRLEPLADPMAWSVQSHRSKVLGSAVALAKQSWLKAVSPMLREILSAQAEWNQAAIDGMAISATGQPVTQQQAQQVMERLTKLGDPLSRRGSSLGTRAITPLWKEVMRRQTQFNREVMLCISNLLGARPTEPAHPPSFDYPQWVKDYEPAKIRRANERLATLTARPKVSVVVPVYNTPEPVLRQCVESVLAQSYDHFELLLADDASPSADTQRVLESYAKKDKRVRVTRLAANGGIAVATNAAIALATGEWIAFLDHDDALRPHALAAMITFLRDNPEVDLAYSDEDRMDADGVRQAPFFKPDWSPDLLRSVNYICHFVFARRSLVQKLGGLREGFDGSQDYDFLLRASEQSRRIGHVPEVLYHWRSSPLSLSSDEQKLKQASERGARALREHLQRVGEEAEVTEAAPTNYRVRYPVRGTPLVSIIVPFKDKPELLEQLLGTLIPKTRYENYELLLVSNNSTQPQTYALLETLNDPRIRKLRWDHPFNYPEINNWAAKQAKGDLLLFLNNDMEVVDPDWLHELISQAQRPEVGTVGPKLLFPDGTLQHVGVVVGIGGYAAHPFWRMADTSVWTPFGTADWARDYLAVTSACVMLRRELFEQLNGYDERYQVCGSDVELGIRCAKLGLRNVYSPYTKLIHHESASRRLDATPDRDFWVSFVDYRAYLKSGDPFYNPNLTLRGVDLNLRGHPESGEELALHTLAVELPRLRQGGVSKRAERVKHTVEHLAGVDHSTEQSARARVDNGTRLAALRARGQVTKMQWFVPAFSQVFGGLHTIFRFADGFRRTHGVENSFVVFDDPRVNAPELEARVSTLFADLPGRFTVLKSRADIADLPAADVTVASSWPSAYAILEHPRAGLRAYFVQDFEAAFHPAGTMYGLAEQSYRLGHFGIFNTYGLREFITTNYPMFGVHFEPSVDHAVFHARRPERKGPARLFFYGRPGSERNAFELGIASLRKLKAELRDKVEILSAGERWRPEDFGLSGVVNNLGVLPYEKTADLYREVDVGLCFMFTKHPSYLPLELMACGATVVTNDNPANHWLLQHGANCLLAEPTVTAVTERLREAVSSRALRDKLSSTAVDRMKHTTWDEQINRVHQGLISQAAIRFPEGPLT